MIRFRCKNCGQKITVGEIHAGKKGKCPKCKSVVIVPKPGDVGSLTSQSATGGFKVSRQVPT